MPDFNGDLTERDALRLLGVLRMVRADLKEQEHEYTIVTTAKVGDVGVDLSLGKFLDLVLDEYKGYDHTEED